jgi:hypothetical protein
VKIGGRWVSLIIRALKPGWCPTEVSTDRATPSKPITGVCKARLRLTARPDMAPRGTGDQPGHAFGQNPRRGHDELGVDIDRPDRPVLGLAWPDLMPGNY